MADWCRDAGIAFDQNIAIPMAQSAGMSPDAVRRMIAGVAEAAKETGREASLLPDVRVKGKLGDVKTFATIRRACRKLGRSEQRVGLSLRHLAALRAPLRPRLVPTAPKFPKNNAAGRDGVESAPMDEAQEAEDLNLNTFISISKLSENEAGKNETGCTLSIFHQATTTNESCECESGRAEAT